MIVIHSMTQDIKNTDELNSKFIDFALEMYRALNGEKSFNELINALETESSEGTKIFEKYLSEEGSFLEHEFAVYLLEESET